MTRKTERGKKLVGEKMLFAIAAAFSKGQLVMGNSFQLFFPF